MNNDSDKKLLQQKCDLLDKQIDKLVYELYELTEEEIKIVDFRVKKMEKLLGVSLSKIKEKQGIFD